VTERRRTAPEHQAGPRTGSPYVPSPRSTAPIADQPPPPVRGTAAERDLTVRRDNAILTIRGLTKRFGGIRAVDGASLEVRRGSITALIGPNGAGKTTLFNVVTGFYRPEAGQVRFEGQPVAGLPPHRLARMGMVRTFQITKALARMPVIDNVMLAGPRQPGESLLGVIARPRAAHRREREVREEALELLELFDLARLAGEYAGTLSGGQRKLLELARALMARPRLLMLDEPMAGINRTLGASLLDHIERLRAEHGVTFLYIEHDMDVVMGHSDRVIVMADGQVIADGEPEEVRSDQRVIDAYLGSDPGRQTA
jgi:neutral amino acid transport system ATP-binding protein